MTRLGWAGQRSGLGDGFLVTEVHIPGFWRESLYYIIVSTTYIALFINTITMRNNHGLGPSSWSSVSRLETWRESVGSSGAVFPRPQHRRHPACITSYYHMTTRCRTAAWQYSVCRLLQNPGESGIESRYQIPVLLVPTY